MEKKFTKGDCVSEKLDNLDILIMCGPKILAEVYSMDVGDDEDIANGELIASAPELLDRLSKLVLSVKAHPDYVNGEDGDEWHDIIDLAEETIKKATE